VGLRGVAVVWEEQGAGVIIAAATLITSLSLFLSLSPSVDTPSSWWWAVGLGGSIGSSNEGHYFLSVRDWFGAVGLARRPYEGPVPEEEAAACTSTPIKRA
jgi:hypothetical protein